MPIRGDRDTREADGLPERSIRLGAVLFRTTRPEVVEGAIIRRSERLHWTSQAAIEEVREWAKELGLNSPFEAEAPVSIAYARDLKRPVAAAE